MDESGGHRSDEREQVPSARPRSSDGAEDHVLLLMNDDRNRELLADRLRQSPRYDVTTRDPDRSPPEGYDICLLDGRGLERCGDAVRRHRKRADPVFLPVVLLATDPDTEVGPVVDDVIELPVDQSALWRRIENLLQARRASVRLSERENQYRRLVELAPESILLVRDRRVVYANAAAVETFGAGNSAALEDHPVESFAVDGDEALGAALDTIAERGRLEFQDVTLQSAAGGTIDAQVAGVTVTYDGDPAVQLVIRDVTAERRREQQLTLFERAIEATVQGVTIADARRPDEPLIYANSAFERITGYDADEVLGRNCRFLQGERTDADAVAEMREAIDGQRPVAIELLNYRKDGTPFWNQIEMVPITGDDGRVTHFLGLQRDVTDRREREERLSVMDRVLRHNIRNRVNVIRGHAETLDDDGEAAEAARQIRNAATDLLRISDQVRRFQGLIAEREGSRSERDLASMLDRIVEGVRSEYPESDVRLTDGDPVPAMVHRGLSGAMEELFELAVAPDPEAARLTVQVRAESEQAVVELVDHGGTIPAADLQAVLEKTETPLRHSSGLELWLVRWAVLHSDGELSVETDDPVRVVMRFPLADGE